MTHTQRSSPVAAVTMLLLMAVLTVEAQQLGRNDKQMLLDRHNSFRADEGASDMRQMVSVCVSYCCEKFSR